MSRITIAAACTCAFLGLGASLAAEEIPVPAPGPRVHLSADDIPFGRFTEVRYQLYVKSTFLGARPFRITDLGFMGLTEDTVQMSAFQMRLAHSTLGQLDRNFEANLVNATTVLQGQVTYPFYSIEFSRIGLSQPFDYNGVDDLVLEFRYNGKVGSLWARSGQNGVQKSRAVGPGSYDQAVSSTRTGDALWVQFVVERVHLTASGALKPGTTVSLDLFAPEDSGVRYQIASSLGNGPTIIANRFTNVSIDGLFLTSISGLLPTVFSGYSGTLDAGGRGAATITLPANPAFVGVRVNSVFLTADASGIRSVSNTASFRIAAP